ncbi:MAG: hypothetical protein ACE5H5_03395 [Nitrospinota bacterium]
MKFRMSLVAVMVMVSPWLLAAWAVPVPSAKSLGLDTPPAVVSVEADTVSPTLGVDEDPPPDDDGGTVSPDEVG